MPTARTESPGPEDVPLGAAIRALRLSRNMTMAELAKRASLSAAMISKIESGDGNPSLNSIREIAAALEVPVAYLFAQEIAWPMEIVAVNHKRVYSYSGATYTVIVSPISKETKVIILEAEAGTERGSVPIPHEPHEGFEQGIVIQGEMTFTVGNKAHVLRPFDSISFPSTLHHGWKNSGPGVCKAVWAITMSETARELELDALQG